MATDAKTLPADPAPAPARPNLKITGLHVRKLKSIEALDLPADGLDWSDAMPDLLMIGGVNGSGKTTLLDFIQAAFEYVAAAATSGDPRTAFSTRLMPEEGSVDFELSAGLLGNQIRFIAGKTKFLFQAAGIDLRGKQSAIDTLDGLNIMAGKEVVAGLRLLERLVDEHDASYRLLKFERLAGRFGFIGPWGDGPKVVCFGSENRSLVVHPEPFKFPGPLSQPSDFVQRWTPPEVWKETLEARLYALRWADLNAKEEGRAEEATHFDPYAQAFGRFFDGRKRIAWHRGELVVMTEGGGIHGLAELSSGEKQAILFMGELLYRWRPGSLILIDEPELHLHESFQTRLFGAIQQWLSERGGQVIIATQSGHLFGLGGFETKVLLTRRRPR